MLENMTIVVTGSARGVGADIAAACAAAGARLVLGDILVEQGEATALARSAADAARLNELTLCLEERSREMRGMESSLREAELEAHKRKLEMLSMRANEGAAPSELAALREKHAQLRQKLSFANRRLKQLLLERRATPGLDDTFAAEVKPVPSERDSLGAGDRVESSRPGDAGARLEELMSLGCALYEA